MIKVYWNNQFISVSGHANKIDKSKNLVCCAVSTIMFSSQTLFNKKSISFNINKKNNSITLALLNKSYSNKKILKMICMQLMYLSTQFPKEIKLLKIKNNML